jgi:hypothetical protein
VICFLGWTRRVDDAFAGDGSHLLHDTSFALREGDVPTRLVLNELDLDLAPLAARLVVVVVVVVGSGRGALSLDAAALGCAILELFLLVVVGIAEVDAFGRHGEVESCAWSLRSFGLQAGRDYPERC